MYRVSPFVRQFATALLSGAALATLWVNLAPASYYDALEWRLAELTPPSWLWPRDLILTLQIVVSHGLMALVFAFVAKELWEAIVLERGALGRGHWRGPGLAVAGGAIGAVAVWIATGSLIETAEEAAFATGWQVPVGADAVLAYVVARAVFGPGHPAVHSALLIATGLDVAGLLVMAASDPQASLRLAWLILPLAASLGTWALIGRPPAPGAPERRRRRGLSLMPWVAAAVVSWLGMAAAGLPPALGLLPIIPAIPHADRAFGLFAEAEAFLHDPLNRLAHLLVRPVTGVLFLFGLTHGGIDLGAWAPTTLTVLAALWIGKPLGIAAGLALAGRAARPPGLTRAELPRLCAVLAMGFTVPVMALDRALPGGAMTEAARLGLALSLIAGPALILVSRRRG